MATSIETSHAEPTVRRSRRRMATRVAALAFAPLLLLAACKPSDIVTEVVGIFGMGKNEVATPQFEIKNGITVQVVVKAPEGEAGIPVTVHVRCSGGTHAAATVLLKDSGSVSLGQTSFQQGWPAGADCLVSQEIVKGVEIASSTIKWLSSTQLRADFLNV
jgi:hypothetical protein